MREYKPLKMFTAQTDELKKLIAEHPDLPIVVLTNEDVVAGDDYGWWYAPKISFSLGELLDCEQDVNNEKVYVDRDDFEEDLRDIMCDLENLKMRQTKSSIRQSRSSWQIMNHTGSMLFRSEQTYRRQKWTCMYVIPGRILNAARHPVMIFAG